MCGIFGFLLDEQLTARDIEKGKKYTQQLSHRGPDHTGFWFDKSDGIFLGHTRLSIIDLAVENNQPFQFKNSILVYNGEIYNYLELKKELISKGNIFKTLGDTEVLSSFLESNQGKELEKLDGMFAFAQYKNQQLSLAIDLFGEKPLYWCRNSSGFYFSSEPAPLIQMLNLQFDESIEKKLMFNTLGYLTNGETFYHGLHRMMPATAINISRNGTPQILKYWSRPKYRFQETNPKHLSNAEVDLIHEAITSSLSVRTRSDVPIGLFLSSGIDSSLIAAMLKKDFDADITALTVKFNSKLIHDESSDASAIASFLKLDHKIVDSSNDHNHSSIASLNQMYGDPCDNTTIFSVNQISAIAKNFFSVAFSGTGGDELFFGYGKHFFLHQNQALLSNRFLKYILSSLKQIPLPVPRKVFTASYLSQYSNLDIMLALKNSSYFDWSELSSSFVSSSALGQPEISNQSLLSQYVDFDIDQNLCGSIIPPLDRGSMLNGLEVRTPFLNRKLLEVITSFDGNRILMSGQKGILKEILSRYLPPSLLNKKKLGFVYPQSLLVDSEVNLSRNKYLDYDPSFKTLFSRRDKNPEIDRLILRYMIYNTVKNEPQKQF
ncbi:asparagine synthase (glutamine-hydrolyzing) [Gammaproteobacteria bacterium]|nr:asparagine synthase (glutamine-hydrolyzing) [Gammaproteobacteria bacterium]